MIEMEIKTKGLTIYEKIGLIILPLMFLWAMWIYSDWAIQKLGIVNGMVVSIVMIIAFAYLLFVWLYRRAQIGSERG